MNGRLAMLRGVLGFVVSLVIGTIGVLAVTVVGAVLVPLVLLFPPVLALGLLLRRSQSVPSEARTGAAEQDEGPAPRRRATGPSLPASAETPRPAVKRAA